MLRPPDALPMDQLFGRRIREGGLMRSPSSTARSRASLTAETGIPPMAATVRRSLPQPFSGRGGPHRSPPGLSPRLSPVVFQTRICSSPGTVWSVSGSSVPSKIGKICPRTCWRSRIEGLKHAPPVFTRRLDGRIMRHRRGPLQTGQIDEISGQPGRINLFTEDFRQRRRVFRQHPDPEACSRGMALSAQQ